MDSIPIICKLFQPATNGDWKHWSASQKPGLWQNWSGVDPAIFMSIWRSNGFWWFSAHITPRNVSSNAPHIAPDSPSSSEAEGREGVMRGRVQPPTRDGHDLWMQEILQQLGNYGMNNDQKWLFTGILRNYLKWWFGFRQWIHSMNVPDVD